MIPPPILLRGRRAGAALGSAAALLLVINVAWAIAHGDLLRPTVPGDVAPEVTVHRVGDDGVPGESLTLSSLRGQVVVLEFWATWCGPCKASLPHLDHLQVTRGGRGLAVLAINMDDPRKARWMWTEDRRHMTLVHDEGHAADRYGVRPIPHVVVIDRQGKVRAVYRGGGHSAEMDALVDRLLAEPAAP